MDFNQEEMQNFLEQTAGKSEEELMDAIVETARAQGGASVLESVYEQMHPFLSEAQRAKMEEVLRRMKGEEY